MATTATTLTKAIKAPWVSESSVLRHSRSVLEEVAAATGAV
jgi:hypothetical protein